MIRLILAVTLGIFLYKLIRALIGWLILILAVKKN